VPVLDPKTEKPILDEQGKPRLVKKPLSGLDFFKKRVRTYPQGDLAAHVLGYVNDDADIAYGVEETAKLMLGKAPAEESRTGAMLDGQGKPIRPEDIDPASINSAAVEDVTLTLDSQLQYICEKALNEGVTRVKADKAAAIMLDPATGEVLAYAVTPGYSPERYFQYPLSVFKNWTLSDVYQPGSTIKILTLGIGLENGVITPDSLIEDTGKLKLGGYTITNYDYVRRGAPGKISLTSLLMHSSNVASAKIAMRLPPEKHRAHLKLLGFGSPTGIDLPSESGGILNPLDTWDKPTQGSIGYGYGIAATPIQLAAAVAAVANQGIWITPHVIKQAPQVVTRRVFSPKTCQDLTRMLVNSIAGNEESTVRLNGVSLAGKTGTSRKSKENEAGYTDNLITSFVGYYPAQHPKALVMVLVDNPKMAESWGSTVAGPIFKQIADSSLPILDIKRLVPNGSPD
jgi:cell division protein FtsI (penicillin-binding protein 3)